MRINHFALLLTLFLLFLIFLTQPTSSVQVFLSGLSNIYAKGTNIHFSIITNISSDEHLPVNYLLLNISGPSNHLCKIYVNGSVENCVFLSVNSIEYDLYTYGYGYSYESGFLGYGYGYGPHMLRINLTMGTNDLEGDYNVKVDVHTGITPNEHIFSSSLYAFTVVRYQDASTETIARAPKYFMEVLGVTNNGREYNVRVKNAGTERLKVYLLLILPDGNQTYEPLMLEAGQESLLNYTIKEGSYNYTVMVVGEGGEVKLTKQIYMQSMQPLQPLEQATEEQVEPTITEEKNEMNLPQKSPLTGLYVGILNALQKHKLIIFITLGMLIAALIAYMLLWKR